jgi:hypothetical protein
MSITKAIDSAVVATASGSGQTWTNDGATGVIAWVNVTAVSGTTPSATFRLQWSPDLGTTWVDWDTTNLQSTAVTTATTVTLKAGPGLPVTANTSKNDVVPRRLRVAYTITGTTPSFTFSSFITGT